MNKQEISCVFDSIESNSYDWALYFFSIDRRNSMPFSFHKVRFKNLEYLPEYAKNLVSITKQYQVDQATAVQAYDGFNTKVSCDTITTESNLLSEEWQLFKTAIENASDEKISGKVKGYVLIGHPVDNDELKPIIFVKCGNPIIDLTNKKRVAYIATEKDELDLISDDIYRLYLTVDFFHYDGSIYAFNHSFEKIFNVEGTLKRVKAHAIEEIILVDAFNDTEAFKGFSKSYTQARTFITLNKERLERISKADQRTNIAGMLQIEIDSQNKFIVADAEKASLLIRYLCYKIFRDDESKDVLEGEAVSKINFT